MNSTGSQRRAGQAEHETYEKEATFSTSFPLMCYHKKSEVNRENVILDSISNISRKEDTVVTRGESWERDLMELIHLSLAKSVQPSEAKSCAL